MDLSGAYARDASSALRGVRITGNGGVEIRDELSLYTASEVRWYLHTDAEEIEITGENRAVLTKNGVSIIFEILSDQSGSLSVSDAVRYAGAAASADSANNGISKLDYSVNSAAGDMYIAVKISLAGTGEGTAPTSPRLADWSDAYGNGN
jgi:hypothetical protein